MIRIGIGQDSHEFDENKILILGGLKIPNHQGLKANSDGDVIIHTLCNAIGSALGKGSISTYADELCLEKGIKDSTEYIKIPLKWVEESHFKLNNVSISIECRTPKIESLREKLTQSLSNILKIDNDRIGITATTGEKLTEFGKGKGIQVIAIVNLIKK